MAMSYKQDPQSNLTILINEGICQATFFLLDANDAEVTDHQGRLIFHNCWAAEFLSSELNPYSCASGQCIPGIFLTKVLEAKWYADKIRDRVAIYLNWRTWDKRVYTHYLLSGHDNYVQIIASDFTFEVIPKGACEMIND